VRYEELERYSGLVDLVLSEATAADVLPRHVSRLLDGRAGRPPRAEGEVIHVMVASASEELKATIAEACANAGYHVEQADDHAVGDRTRGCHDRASSGEPLLTIWDVPILDQWTDRLERHARQTGPVLALMGFPDRAAVALAKSSGAIACLELPLNLDDLIDVIERFSRAEPRELRAAPARVEPPHLLPPRSRRRVVDRAKQAEEAQWPASKTTPTIGE
jgi:DNA-binding response OmpR family regulator